MARDEGGTDCVDPEELRERGALQLAEALLGCDSGAVKYPRRY